MAQAEIASGPTRENCVCLARRKFVPLLAFGLCLVLAGCGPETTWTGESRSPDGKWIARGKTLERGGPGNNSLDSYVELARADKPDQATSVVGLNHEFPGHDAQIGMHWTSASHLEVTYGKQRTNIFHLVVLFDGITVSTRYVGPPV